MAGARKNKTNRTERDWTRLPVNVVDIITQLVVEADVVDYFSFRATCHDWRSYTQQSVPDSSASCFHPRRWIMLSDGDGYSTELRFFLNTSTGRLLRIKVPELRKQHRFLTTADGLLIIGHDKGTKLPNPLTRFCIRFPPFPFNLDVREGRVTGAAVTSAYTVIFCIELYNSHRVLYAKRNSRSWTTLGNGTFLADDMGFQNTLLFQDVLYTVDATGIIKGLNLNTQPIVRIIIPGTFDSNSLSFFLVECRGQMLLVRKNCIDGTGSYSADFKVFVVEFTLKSLIPVSSIGDQAVIISNERTMSISAGCFPFIEANSIYFVRHIKLIDYTYRMGCVYNLASGSAQNLHLFRILHQLNHSRQPKDEHQRIEQRILIRPYSFMDHILCYSYHQAWCKGVMFLEFYKKIV